eukprot:5245390-Pleurochrysis_carterae.AAC.1
MQIRARADLRAYACAQVLRSVRARVLRVALRFGGLTVSDLVGNVDDGTGGDAHIALRAFAPAGPSPACNAPQPPPPPPPPRGSFAAAA